MLDPTNVPSVTSDETLARFIVHSSHVRQSTNTVKPDAFIPHPRVELSVTRHLEAAVEELWREGERVAASRKATCYGRADVLAEVIEREQLLVVAKPLDANPNHADVVNWPPEKPQQKMKATEIASRSLFVPAPS